MIELLAKQVNENSKKNFQGPCKLLQAHIKMCDEMKHTNKQEKQRTHKDVIDGRKHFIRCI